MALSESVGGTQSATVGTEHTLATIVAAGYYHFGVDLSNMANGDTVELRAYVKLRSSSSSIILFERVYKHAQGAEKIVISPPIPAPFELKVTLKQTTGAGRSFQWSVYAA